MVSRSAARAASLFARSARRSWTWSSTFRTSPFSAHPARSPRSRTTALRRATEVIATTDHFELVAPVLRPGGFVVALRERFLLAPRLRLDAAAVDSVTDEILLGRLRAAITERQVVLVRAALIAMPADADAEIGVGLQNRHFLIKDRRILGTDGRLVVVEVDHRRQRGAHFFGRPAERGERIRLPLPGHALRFLARPPVRLGLRRGDRVLPRPLGRCRRVGVRLRSRLRRGVRGTRARPDGDAEANHEEQRYRFHPVSPIRGWKKEPPKAVETKPANARRSAAAAAGYGRFQDR